jgi:hypothetical protein
MNINIKVRVLSVDLTPENREGSSSNLPFCILMTLADCDLDTHHVEEQQQREHQRPRLSRSKGPDANSTMPLKVKGRV